MKAIILAGGQSSRMGHDKAQLLLNNARLIDHVYDAIKVQVNEVLISGKQDYGLGLPVIPDMLSGPKGPVGALYSVWKSLKNELDVEGFFTVPVDAPNLPRDLCERLYGEKSAVAMASDGMHQAFAWWLMDDLASIFNNVDLNDSMSLRFLVGETGARCVHWIDESSFYNINTPNDLSRYLTISSSKYSQL